MSKPGRLYDVTVRIKSGEGGAEVFTEKTERVRAYDVQDAMYQAFIQLADPRIDKVIKIEPAEDDEARRLRDLASMLGREDIR